jgi:hypothetical protein
VRYGRSRSRPPHTHVTGIDVSAPGSPKTYCPNPSHAASNAGADKNAFESAITVSLSNDAGLP